MATYSNSKLGESVRSTWRGIHYLRSRSGKSSKPPTILQLAVRAKMALAATMLHPIKSVLAMGFSEKKQKGVNYYNASMKAFLAAAIVGDYPNFTVDYSKMMVSMGTLGGLVEVTMGYSTLLTLNWSRELNSFRFFGDDRVVVIIYNQTTNMYLIDEHATRLDGCLSIDIASTICDAIHVWVFCVSRDVKKVSASQYVGTMVLG